MSGPLPQPSAVLAAAACPLHGTAHDHDALLALIGAARFVLLGEASHGTHEFYEERARITQRLIEEQGFCGVAAEADWPDAYRVNRYVRGEGGDPDARRALDGFRRFPAWMWRNTDVLDFTAWLRRHNAQRAPAAQAGFYGLDLYSLFTSIDEVLRYLDQVDPPAAQEARARYACFDQYAANGRQYAYEAGIGRSESCASGAITQLHQLQQRALDYMQGDGAQAGDAYFCAQQNARLVMNAEEYYRTMFRGSVASWNLRDRHMAETLDALALHLGKVNGRPAKLVVWAHNSHLGDARATEAGRAGEWNLGQLVRERYGEACCLVGFSTYQGWVTAASHWDGPAERKRVRPGLPGSYEAVFHDSGLGRFMLPLRPAGAARDALMDARLQRAIGVLYLPQRERQSHYHHAQLARQFDAMIHIDATEAVQPLEVLGQHGGGDAPETFPAGV